MNRYKKANEDIHVPEEVKEKAARPAGKRAYAPWMGAVAAVLAVAMIGGIAMWPGRVPGHANDPNEPTALSDDGPTGPAGRNAEQPETYSAHALALAAYPEIHPYPRQDEYFDDYTDESSTAYELALAEWRADMMELKSYSDYTGLMDGFLSRSAAQFLTGAGEENRIYSPINVYMALSMLAEATGENTRAQILELLQADSIEALRERASALWKDHYRDDGTVTSILGNSLWLRDDFTYSQKVLDVLAKDYYASSFSGKMGSAEYDQALRDWINGQTNGLLAEQASQLKMDPRTALALASTIYFKAAWDGEFSKEATETDTFHAPGGDVDADFMHHTLEHSYYYWGDHFAAVQLPFQEGGSMWLILPDEGYSVDELLQSGEAMDFLLADKHGKWDEKAQESVGAWPGQKYLTINLSMPKFDVSSDLDLIEGLKALGVTDVFDMNVSNFDPLEASTDDPLYVGKAQHAARVKVDEEGCEAAAYTVMFVYCGAAMPPDEEVDFVLDRPFLFAVTGETGLPLFVGAVNQPNG